MNNFQLENDIAFVGCGNIARALIKGLINADPLNADKINVFSRNPSRVQEFMSNENLLFKNFDNMNEAVVDKRIIILAVKPKDIPEVARKLAMFLSSSQILVSLAGGISCSELKGYFPTNPGIVRVMPNVASMLGFGMSIIYSEDKLAAMEVHEFCSATGKSLILEKEDEMDIAGVLGACVPAYVSLMIEALSDSGIKMGLSWETALLVASQAIVGGGCLVSDGLLHPSEIKNMVASPAGTTIAGIYQLEKHNFRAAIMSAVEASTLRAKELSNNTNKVLK